MRQSRQPREEPLSMRLCLLHVALTLMKVAVVRVRVAYGLQLLYSLSNMFNILNANNHAVSTNTIE